MAANTFPTTGKAGAGTTAMDGFVMGVSGSLTGNQINEEVKAVVLGTQVDNTALSDAIYNMLKTKYDI